MRDRLGREIRDSKIIAVSPDNYVDDDEEQFYSISSKVTSAAMLDTGNFVLYGQTGHSVVWQSFQFPTDTILGGQNLTADDELVSSGGSGFRLLMKSDGNLVLYTANGLISVEEDSYWVLDTSRNNDPDLCLNTSGSLYVLSRSGESESDDSISESCRQREAYVLLNGTSGRSAGSRENDRASLVYRATLDTDGIFRVYSHSFSRADGNSSGVVIWSALQDKCEIKGFCGFNSFCWGSRRAVCRCYPGFVFINSSNKNLGCYQNFTEESCVSVGEEDLPVEPRPRPRLRYDISTIANLSWRDHSYSCTQKLDKELCSKSCLDDCSCWAALYNRRTNDCKKYRLPVMYGKRNPNMSAIAFFKVVSKTTDDIPPYSRNHIKISVDEKNGLIIALASSLGSVLCLLFFLAVASFVIYRRRVYSYKRLLENANLVLAEDYYSLQQFSYNELESATKGFSEELGSGSFGAVYKGTTGNRAVAVKRLERVVEEGVREFRAEITTIGQTHHRNLVQLVGFCVEGSKRLLVYEFMSNGPLSDHLFKAALRPAWKDRARFALDVARGLFYLHEECGVHIIHCNLNPQNILLDDTLTAKISDFGFARLIMPNQAKLTSGDGESTGYFAPEWQKNALISVKSDIYSFGVVLFEIVCCRRNIDVKVSSPDEIVLSSWVYNCYVSGELIKLVGSGDGDDDSLDMKALERMVKVGLWCVQDEPALRPLMKNVILMLEGTMDIPIPPSPQLPLIR